MRAIPKVLAGLLVGSILGATLTLAVQSRGEQLGDAQPSASNASATPEGDPVAPATFLAWVPGGLPPGFARSVAGLPSIDRLTAVAEDNVWMTRSWSSDGALVDDPGRPYAIPIDAAAVSPRSFGAFLPPPDRGIVAALADGQAVLGATSAALRGLGPGAELAFEGGTRVRIVDVLPDELVGAAELMVSKATGAAIGVHRQRYLLLQPRGGASITSTELIRRLRPLLPADLGIYRRVQVRAPGETPFFRSGDAVLPPVMIKALFGEFAARPSPGRPGYLDIDPAWVRAHIVTVTVPLLGEVTCNRALIPQLRDAMSSLQRRGLGSLIDSYAGCFAPRFVNRDPTAMLSHHAWGIAFDCNFAGNAYGEVPHQDPRLVRTMERFGFIWGGTFIVPDGNHFEYRRAPATTG
ncbi:MAG: M15 family metallopeptidase [Actinomycetota bacterium]